VKCQLKQGISAEYNENKIVSSREGFFFEDVSKVGRILSRFSSARALLSRSEMEGAARKLLV
jgi:hypothetical protein